MPPEGFEPTISASERPKTYALTYALTARPLGSAGSNSTRNISWGVKAAGAYGWQPYHLHVLIVLKSGSLSLLEPSGIALPLPNIMISSLLLLCFQMAVFQEVFPPQLLKRYCISMLCSCATVGVTWLIRLGGDRPCLLPASRKTQVFNFFCLYTTQIIVLKIFLFLFDAFQLSSQTDILR